MPATSVEARLVEAPKLWPEAFEQFEQVVAECVLVDGLGALTVRAGCLHREGLA
jgi:hypothetical protein